MGFFAGSSSLLCHDVAVSTGFCCGLTEGQPGKLEGPLTVGLETAGGLGVVVTEGVTTVAGVELSTDNGPEISSRARDGCIAWESSWGLERPLLTAALRPVFGVSAET